MTSDVSIETVRLIIRTVTMADIENVASSWKLDDRSIPLAEAEQKILWMLSNHAQNSPEKLIHLCLAIIIKDTNEFVGWCGLDHLDQTKVDPALFYLLKANYWGKGLATEAARALLSYAFTQMELASIHGGAAPENLASKRVMEKLGMKYVGLDEEGGYAFTITQEEYWNIDGNKMRSKLILIGGEAWTGKSTCARILFERLPNSAWLDGDDVWRVNPWSLDDPRLRTSDTNMAFVLQTYLQSKFDYVILSSIVLSDPFIIARILERIRNIEYDLLSFTLMCDEATLTERAKRRDGESNPQFFLLEATRALINTIKIDTSNKKPEKIVDEMLPVIHGK